MPRNNYNFAILSLLILNLFLLFWNFGRAAENTTLYFLNVNQGESELINTGGAKILIDAGYGNQIASALDKISSEKYIDLGIISELQTDYFNGYNFLLQNYALGAILWNGREVNSPEWQSLLAEAKGQKVPMIPVSAGDIIHTGDTTIKVVSPNAKFLKGGEADASLVLNVNFPEADAVFAGGIGANVELALLKTLTQADILKVPAHASKNSSSQEFLNAMKPRISVIATGPKIFPNTEALGRLKAVNSLVFQTGLSGTIKIVPKNGKFQVFTKKD